MVADAIEIGARVLDREQAGASVEVLRADLEKASRDVEARLGETSEQVVTELRTRLEEAFGPDQGHVTQGAAAPLRRRVLGARCSTRSAPRSAELLNESRERLFKPVLLGRGVQPAGRVPEATRWRRSASRPTSSTPTCAR